MAQITTDRLDTLRALLDQPIQRDADVVYVLVEVRKVIDLLPGRFTVLKFFCDWILHPAMDRRAAREILTAFDGYLGSVLTNAPAALEMMNNVSGLIALTRFRDDLFVFLGEHRLDTSLIANLNRWEHFLGAYVDIISKTPLAVGSSTYKNLDEIRVRKLTAPSRGPTILTDRFIFGIEWLFNKAGMKQMSMFNEIWFPAEPRIVSVPVGRFEQKDGQVLFVPQESQTFWN